MRALCRRLALRIDPSIRTIIEQSPLPKGMRRPLIDAVRYQLEGITISHEVKGSLLDGMTTEQETDFCEKASDVLKNPTFLTTVHHLIAQQVDYTVKRASNMDEVLFGRATINGLSLLKEQFEALTARAEELRKVEEQFDPLDVI